MLTPDNTMSLIAGDFSKKARHAGSIIHPIESHTPNQYHAESMACEIKCMYCKAMHASNAPLMFWDQCFELQSLTRSHTALNLPTLEGMTPMEKLTGDTGSLPELCFFSHLFALHFICITFAFHLHFA